MATTHHPLGIDIGGSGIKGAPVDLTEGVFARERLRLDTPKVSSPDAVADLVAQIAKHVRGRYRRLPHRRDLARRRHQRCGAERREH